MAYPLLGAVTNPRHRSGTDMSVTTARADVEAVEATLVEHVEPTLTLLRDGQLTRATP